MSVNDRDDRLEELLRTSLHEEADMTVPAGDGLNRIHHRIDERRSRSAWLKPAAVLGAMAAVAAAGFGAYALTQDNGGKAQVTVPPADSPSPTPSTSSIPPAPAAVVAFPAAAFYPFASQAQEASWESSGGPTGTPTYTDPQEEALSFLATFLQQPTVNRVVSSKTSGDEQLVTLGREFTDGSSTRTVAVTTVRMVKFGKAWVVVGADDAGGLLTLTTPTSGSRVSSPVTVSGPSYGVDEAITVRVRSLSGDDTAGSGGHASFGNGTGPWSTTVAFATPSDPAGAVVAVEPSAADGGPGRIAVTGVRFGGSQTATYPAAFYGIKDQRVAKFSSRNGAALSYLTDPQPGGASDPQLVGVNVYFIAGGSTCANAVSEVPTAGGAVSVVRSADPGYAVQSYAVSTDESRVALFETACANAPTGPQGKLVSKILRSSTSHTIDFPSFPPEVIGDPAWESDDTHLDVIVQTGTMSGLQRYDAFAAKSWSDSTTACSGYDANNGQPTAIDVDGSGALWIAAGTGSSMQVQRCSNGKTETAFEVSGADTPADLAVTGNGTAALLTDANGKVWRWSGAAQTDQLSPSVPLDHVTW